MIKKNYLSVLKIQNLKKHLQQVREGGWRIFLRKSRKFFIQTSYFILMLAAAPIVLVIVLARPVIYLRFGAMVSDRIGHFILDVEAYRISRKREFTGRRTVDIIGCPEPVCNIQIRSMWEREICITTGGRLWQFFDKACRFWTRSEKHHVKLYDRSQEYKLFSYSETALKFTEKEVLHGQNLLRDLGVPSGASWICIHNRDPVYLDRLFSGRSAYHDYRNFSIKHMLEALDELTRRGYYVLRMGSIVEQELNCRNPMVIDYASSDLQSDFADIYLLAGCAAYIGSDSGIWGVPFVFRRPVSFINFSSTLIFLLVDQGVNYPFIIKRLWHKNKQRFLTLREIFEAGLAGAAESYRFELAGVEPVSNTSDDIHNLAIEIDERLNDRWKSQLVDEELQRRFWEIFCQYYPSYRAKEISARIGATFLRNHYDLLN